MHALRTEVTRRSALMVYDTHNGCWRHLSPERFWRKNGVIAWNTPTVQGGETEPPRAVRPTAELADRVAHYRTPWEAKAAGDRARQLMGLPVYGRGRVVQLLVEETSSPPEPEGPTVLELGRRAVQAAQSVAVDIGTLEREARDQIRELERENARLRKKNALVAAENARRHSQYYAMERKWRRAERELRELQEPLF